MPAARASGITRTIYNTIFKRNSVFVTTIFVGAIGFTMGFDTITTKVWDDINRGAQMCSFFMLLPNL
ncbi:ubiquinol-cytochrome C reductase [Mycotypha africana]|uniref:ubiquinol-cytochrome C reductase n=1 Tax=Mycotypha africana TaxID=64632 RepID=UPI00230152CF|nr:ubiquinol-cytochrome C reductase [Mycotypha africana]KAI8979408.1 ubiquinol-cytochrome C reductase [Mycotypha africana]